MLRKAFAIAAVLGLAATAQASFAATTEATPKDVHWSFEGPLGRFDQEQLQRGYKVYHDVCSSCHAMHLMSYRNLGQPGGPFYDPKYPNPNDNPYVKSIVADYKVPDIDSDTGDVIKRPATPADAFVSPFPNEAAARASNGGALPPDLSLVVKAREGGAHYVYSFLTGFHEKPPAGFTVMTGKYFNPYFEGWNVSMPNTALVANAVTYSDGTQATIDQEAHDVATFLAWASDPKMEERKQMGFGVLIFLVVLAGLLFAAYRKVWKDAH